MSLRQQCPAQYLAQRRPFMSHCRVCRWNPGEQDLTCFDSFYWDWIPRRSKTGQKGPIATRTSITKIMEAQILSPAQEKGQGRPNGVGKLTELWGMKTLENGTRVVIGIQRNTWRSVWTEASWERWIQKDTESQDHGNQHEKSWHPAKNHPALIKCLLCARRCDMHWG